MQPGYMPRGRVEVKVSYGARMGCALAIGIVIMLVGIAALASYYLSAPDSAASTASKPSTAPCGTGTSSRTLANGPLSCPDRASSSGQSYYWSATEAGTYTFAAKDSTVSQCIGVELKEIKNNLISYHSLAYECGRTGGAEATLTLKPGEYAVRVTDLLSSAGTATHPYTLSITKSGAPPPAAPKDADARPFPAPILVFFLLGAVFLVIPLVLGGEKKRIPLYIDPMGVTMRNGAVFPWQEYRGIRVLTERRASSSHATEVGVELMFARGTALIRYRPITNAGEVLWITDQLKQGRNPFAG